MKFFLAGKPVNIRCAKSEWAMNCTECATPMKSRRENYRYIESGLRYVTLVGLTVSRCPRCDNIEVAIPRIELLHNLIARALIDKQTRFTGEEVRFLRKSLDWSGSAFAKHMGVAEETVSRWENDAAPIGPQADRLLRVLVAQGRLTTSYPTAQLAMINPRKAAITRLKLESQNERWALRSA